MKSVAAGIIRAYIYALFIFAVCYYDNGYFNIIDAKSYVCLLLLLIFVPLLIVISAVSVVIKIGRDKHKSFSGKAGMNNKLCLTDISAAVFAVAAVLSCLSAGSAKAALLGSGGWGCGALLITLLSLMYVFISRLNDITDEKILIPIIAGGFITFIWAALNYAGIDIGNMHSGFYNPETIKYYLAGIGNVNNFSAYLSMLIPFAVLVFAQTPNKLWKLLSGIYLLLGGFCTVIIITDSVYLGLGLAGVAIIVYALGSLNRIRRISLPLAICFTGAAFAGVSDRLLFEGAHKLSGISEALADKYIFVVAAVFLYTVAILLRRKKVELSEKFVRISRCVFGIVFAAGVTVGTVFLFSDFDDSWGSRRGFIWTKAAQLFSSLPVSQKLLGLGCDCFGTAFHGAYNREILENFGMTVSNAHNEPLQYLLTTGIFGLSAYLLVYIGVLVEMIKNKERQPLSVAAFFGIVGYAGQALVNNPHAYNCSVLFVMLALFAAGSIQTAYKTTSLPLSADS